jgi:hypothetical protein
MERDSRGLQAYFTSSYASLPRVSPTTTTSQPLSLTLSHTTALPTAHSVTITRPPISWTATLQIRACATKKYLFLPFTPFSWTSHPPRPRNRCRFANPSNATYTPSLDEREKLTAPEVLSCSKTEMRCPSAGQAARSYGKQNENKYPIRVFGTECCNVCNGRAELYAHHR